MDCVETSRRYFGKEPRINACINEEASGVMVRFSGYFDLQTSSLLQDMLLDIIGSMTDHTRLLIDLGEVSYMPSSAIGALTIALISARKRDIRLQLGRIQPKVRSVFELLGFMGYFEETSADA